MLNRTQFPKQLEKGIRTAFMTSFTGYPVVYDQMVTVLPSDASDEDYAWLGDASNIQEWKDELEQGTISEYNFSITNKKYGDKLFIDADLLDDEKYGQVIQKARGLGQAVARFIGKTVTEKLVAGFSTACYDGQYFFSSTHNESGSNQSNTNTSALDATSLKAAMTAFYKTTDDKGNRMGLRPDTIVIPPDLEWTAKTLINGTVVTGTADAPALNTLKGILNIIVDPNLTDTNNWYLMRLSDSPRPLIWQNRMNPQLMGPYYDEEKDGWKFMLKFRGAVGYGRWQSAYGVAVTGA